MIPEGMHDVLPPEARELRAIVTALCGRFEAYGYGEVSTPWLEFAETLEIAGDDTLEAGYRLHDQQGHELMLRTDMTVPVARLAASHYRDAPLPLRFFYVAPSIRPWAPQRSQDGEFVQAGAELLGLHSAAADAECVTLLCDCLSSLGVRDYRVALGTVDFYTALVDALGLAAVDREKFLEALSDRDYPLLESIAGKAEADGAALDALWCTLELSGTRDSLSQARKLARSPAMEAAIEHLVTVRDLVEVAGFDDAVTFDFGLFQDLTYYRGVIFEAYAPGVGLPIASGGRYDGLWRASTGTCPAWASPSPWIGCRRLSRRSGRRWLRLRLSWPTSAASQTRRGRPSCAARAGRWWPCPRARPGPCVRCCVVTAVPSAWSWPTAPW